jgi:hypothetical protein
MIEGFRTPIASTEDFERAAATPEWEAYVREKSKFQTWADMQTKAGVEYAQRRLNLGNL